MIDSLDAAIGMRVRQRRNVLGITQSGLAQHLGITFQQVQKYERGTNRIAVSTLIRIAEKLETTVASLAGEDEGPHGDEPSAAPGATELLRAFGQISPQRQKMLLEVARGLILANDSTPSSGKK